jgi:hypothetical protein
LPIIGFDIVDPSLLAAVLSADHDDMFKKERKIIKCFLKIVDSFLNSKRLR